jgi:hypothetical protein
MSHEQPPSAPSGETDRVNNDQKKVNIALSVEENEGASHIDERKSAEPTPASHAAAAESAALSALGAPPSGKRYDDPRVGFPDTRPTAPPFEHGWFLQTHVNVFSALITEQTKVIFEIGSWYGASTKWVRRCCCIMLPADM